MNIHSTATHNVSQEGEGATAELKVCTLLRVESCKGGGGQAKLHKRVYLS